MTIFSDVQQRGDVRVARRSETITIMLAFAVTIWMVIYPPWRQTYPFREYPPARAYVYHWIFEAPGTPDWAWGRGLTLNYRWQSEIDVKRLLIQIVAVWTATLGVVYFLRADKSRAD